MVTVVIINTLIALFNFYIAWRIWKIRKAIAIAANAIIIAERNTHNVLHPAPQAITIGQRGTSALRERYQVLQLQTQKLQQIFNLLTFGRKIWQKQNQTPKPSKKRSKKSYSPNPVKEVDKKRS